MLSLRRLCSKEGSQKGRKEVASLTERKNRLLAAVIIHHFSQYTLTEEWKNTSDAIHLAMNMIK